ncbi:MAG: hypothetical protein A3K10_17900 [Bacteroidetes bacterium RIFCSPLOWO2_12_FULL_31_6]|nr:MAG: hypothetical protein A3K10_17900 [Bacteroidetes bacterium RIFCSPLOWO2_12_FULL_31_6]
MHAVGTALYVSGGTLYVDGDLTVDGDATTGDALIAAGGTLNLGTAAANLRTQSFQMNGTLSGNSASTVTVSGGSITGSSAITIPGNLTLSGNASLGQSVTVTTVTAIGTNQLTLGGNTLTLASSSTAAITKSGAGGVISESSTLASKLAWAIGTTNGTYAFPLITSGGGDVTVTMVTSGGLDIGTASVATYASNSANSPKPTGITHVSGVSDQVVDRYWELFRTAATQNPDVTLKYVDGEIPSNGGEASMVAQSANTGSNVWYDGSTTAPSGQSANAGANTVTITAFSRFGSPLTMSNGGGAGALGAAPLPVELTHFSASCTDGQVTINWTTATETDNHGFEIERSLDGQSNFAMVASQYLQEYESNSTVPKSYMAIDPSPLGGTSYYRLKQIDNNGATEYFDPVPVSCGGVTGFDITSIITNGDEQSIGVVFNTDEDEIVYYTLIDYRGQRIAEQSINAKAGTNQVIISTATVNKGIYLFSIKNKQKTVTDKVVLQ